jgi:hypothetical protein
MAAHREAGGFRVNGYGAGRMLDIAENTTFWEKCASTGWGSYISAVERTLILRVLSITDHPARSKSTVKAADGPAFWRTRLAGALTSMSIVLAVCRKRMLQAECLLVSRTDTQLPCESNSVTLLLCIEVVAGFAARMVSRRGRPRPPGSWPARHHQRQPVFMARSIRGPARVPDPFMQPGNERLVDIASGRCTKRATPRFHSFASAIRVLSACALPLKSSLG